MFINDYLYGSANKYRVTKYNKAFKKNNKYLFIYLIPYYILLKLRC